MHIQYFRFTAFYTNCTNTIIVGDLYAALYRFHVTVKIYNILNLGTASDNPGGSGIFDVQVRTDNNPWVLATPQSAGNWSAFP